MKIIHLFPFFAAVLAPFLASAQSPDITAAYSPAEFTSPAGGKLLYRIHRLAEVAEGKKYPLILFFHGAGERGVDNAAQLRHGASDLVRFSTEKNRPVFIVAPQCPPGQQWVAVPWNGDAHTMPETPSEPMRLAMELLDQLLKTLPVDPALVSVTGLSMGGFGTWDILQRKPSLFHAAVPVCGGGDAARAESIKSVPVWVYHGGNDTVVKTLRSREMVAALEKAGGKPKYTELEGVGHNSWSPAYSNPEVFDWLTLKHER